jgi:hypothetical protein
MGEGEITRPSSKRQLKEFVKTFLNIDIPSKKICPGHSSPLDYLWHSFSADFGKSRKGNADCVVWANRAGGKTELAAIATLLDLVFKPNCQIRILGGSGEQAKRLYDYLTGYLNMGFKEFLDGPARKESCKFTNGSSVEVITQSATAVRGQHIHKLRCDEVELFSDDVFAAAKFTTQSTFELTAAMELISTMHRPYGLMQQCVSSAVERKIPIFKWCIWEVVERCRGRKCAVCPLLRDCQGKAKKADGYLKIDDLITAMKRSSRSAWESEMLCTKPSLEDAVFDNFDVEIHVREIDYDPNLPVFLALDFGFINPFVCLWIQVDKEDNVYVIDEYCRSRVTLDNHAQQLKLLTPGGVKNAGGVYCDPAGAGTNDITGTSAVKELKDLGITVKYRSSGILEGIDLIRRSLCSANGKNHLFINNRCQKLIEAMMCYHYPESQSGGKELPLKDGIYDHPIDALRYFFVNYKRKSQNAIYRSY